VTHAPSVLLLHGVGSSADTWWRVEQDLTTLGWRTLALDLPGHGARPFPATGLGTMADLAEDVWTQLDGRRFHLLVGHSLGALVALDLARTHPELAGRVVLVDPPGLGGALTVDDVADELVAEAERTRTDPDGMRVELAAQNPAWSRTDVDGVLGNRRRLDAVAVPAFLRRQTWDLPALVVDCPVPLALIVADEPGSLLLEPDRSRVLAALAPDRVVQLPGGHGLHRDRPALFLHALLALAEAAGADSEPAVSP
jgi:pimeloyl-ACP methyl ester carboxylesterase